MFSVGIYKSDDALEANPALVPFEFGSPIGLGGGFPINLRNTGHKTQDTDLRCCKNFQLGGGGVNH